jgi:hypothetical protein
VFVYLPTGEMVNTDHITRIVPLTSGFTRIFYLSGEQVDYPEDYATLIDNSLNQVPGGSASPGKRKAKPTTK